MTSLMELNEDTIRNDIEKARGEGASSVELAGLYSHLVNYLLTKASTELRDIKAAAIDYNDPKYSNDLTTEAAVHMPDREFVRQYMRTEMPVPIDDIAVPVERREGIDAQESMTPVYEIKGHDKVVTYRNRIRAHRKALDDICNNNEDMSRIRALLVKDPGQRKTDFDALRHLEGGYTGNILASLHDVRAFSESALNGLFTDDSRERMEMQRVMTSLSKQQEGMVFELTKRLFEKRHEGIKALVEDHVYPEKVQALLDQSLAASSQALALMDTHHEAVAKEHER